MRLLTSFFRITARVLMMSGSAFAAEPPPDIDGISILPALLEGKLIEHPPLYFEFHERGFDQAARMGNWKGVRHGLKQPLELYDLNTDLAEAHDVAARHPEIVKRIEQYLQTARTESDLWPIKEGKPAAKAKKAKASR